MTVVGPPWEIYYSYYWMIRDFVDRVNWLLHYFPDSSVTSWYRDPTHNAAVGGDPHSQHLLALAVDVVPRADVNYFCGGARAAGLVPVVESSHVHVQRYSAGTLPAGWFPGE